MSWAGYRSLCLLTGAHMVINTSCFTLWTEMPAVPWQFQKILLISQIYPTALEIASKVRRILFCLVLFSFVPAWCYRRARIFWIWGTAEQYDTTSSGRNCWLPHQELHGFSPPLAQGWLLLQKPVKILYTVMRSFQLHMLSSLIQTSFNPKMPPVMNYSSAMNFICFVTRKSGKQTVSHYFNLKISKEEDNPVWLTTSDYVWIKLPVVLVSWFSTKPEFWRKASWSHNLHVNSASAIYSSPTSCLIANNSAVWKVYNCWMQQLYSSANTGGISDKIIYWCS